MSDADRDRVPWDELDPAQRDNFTMLLQELGLDVDVDEAEQYYGNKERAIRDLRRDD